MRVPSLIVDAIKERQYNVFQRDGSKTAMHGWRVLHAARTLVVFSPTVDTFNS
jgi:hypothetical protein